MKNIFNEGMLKACQDADDVRGGSLRGDDWLLNLLIST